MLIDFLSRRARASTSADRPCCWEDTSSELGLDTGSAPAAAPEPAAGDTPAGDEPAHDDPAHATGDSGEPEDDDADVDPLDLLTERDEPEDGAPQRTIEDRYKALSKRSRKLERTVKKSLPVVQALREAGVDLRTLLSRNQQLANLEAAMDRNPRLRALLEGSGDVDDRPAASDRRAPADEPVEYPFDVNDPVGRFMSDFHKSATSSSREILNRLDQLERGLNTRVGSIEQRTAAQQRSAVIGTWHTAAEAAAKQLDPNVRNIFLDAVKAAAEGSLTGRHKLTPQQVIDHYLKPLNVSKGQKDRASAAAAQRTAERNTNLPRRPAQGSGTPASPAARKIPRLEEFNRNLSRTFAR